MNVQTIAKYIAPLAALIGNGEPDKIKAAAEKLAQVVMAELPKQPESWQEIADAAHALAVKGATIIDEIN